MYCPQCKLEYREGFTQCSECEVPLVEGDSPVYGGDPAPPDPVTVSEGGDPAPLELVTVFEGGDPVVLAMAHSLLDEEQIPYVTVGEGLQDLFGMGRIGAGFNIAMGPAKIQVTADREAEVRALLDQLEVDAAEHAQGDENGEGVEDAEGETAP